MTISILPPTEQEPKWQLQAEFLPPTKPYWTHTFIISEAVAKVFADCGMRANPQTLEEALHKALDYFDDHGIRLAKRLRKTLEFQLSLFDEFALRNLPQIYHDCRRAKEAVEEAETTYYLLHEQLMLWVADTLKLPTDTDLVEGPHDCHKSPIRVCVYNNDEDKCHDDCLFCGEPEERK